MVATIDGFLRQSWGDVAERRLIIWAEVPSRRRKKPTIDEKRVNRGYLFKHYAR